MGRPQTVLLLSCPVSSVLCPVTRVLSCRSHRPPFAHVLIRVEPVFGAILRSHRLHSTDALHLSEAASISTLTSCCNCCADRFGGGGDSARECVRTQRRPDVSAAATTEQYSRVLYTRTMSSSSRVDSHSLPIEPNANEPIANAPPCASCLVRVACRSHTCRTRKFC